MIRLSEDGKTFVEIKSWEDLLERPGFRQRLDPAEIKLKEILGQYTISPQQPCGLKRCGTKHNRGYLVAAEGGVETNIGNVCGKTYFGVNFTDLHKQFKTSINAQRFRENLGALKHQLEKYGEQVEVLSNGDSQGNWCYEKMHFWMSKGFDERTTRALDRRRQRSEPQVTYVLERTEDEKELAAATGNTGSTETELIFIIAGLNATSSYKTLRTLLHQTLGSEMNAFEQLDLDSLTYTDLVRWNRWGKNIEKNLNKARSIIEDCNRFLVKSNMDNILANKRYL